MSTAALTNLWNYIQGIQRIERGREEIRSGQCTTCKTKEDLYSFLEAL